MYKPKDYKYQIAWSQEDDIFVVHVVDFPGLSAHGNTPEGAFAEAMSVVETSLRILQEDGEELPVPLSQQKFSGKVPLRITATLHGKLAAAANREGLSLNAFIAHQLEEAV